LSSVETAFDRGIEVGVQLTKLEVQALMDLAKYVMYNRGDVPLVISSEKESALPGALEKLRESFEGGGLPLNAPGHITYADVFQFADRVGGQKVHESWRNGMWAQAREVSSERQVWGLLPDKDKVLDRMIAIAVVEEFIDYLKAVK
jgi:hypothetical protein